jgi:hypothetical protein
VAWVLPCSPPTNRQTERTQANLVMRKNSGCFCNIVAKHRLGGVGTEHDRQNCRDDYGPHGGLARAGKKTFTGCKCLTVGIGNRPGRKADTNQPKLPGARQGFQTDGPGWKKLSSKGLTSFCATPTFPLSFLRVSYPLQNETTYTISPGRVDVDLSKMVWSDH